MNKKDRLELEAKCATLLKVIEHFMPRGPDKFRAVTLLNSILHLVKHARRQEYFDEAKELYDKWQLSRGSIKQDRNTDKSNRTGV